MIWNKDLGKVDVVQEEIYEGGEKLSVELTDKTGVLYTYSQEILGDDEQVLDTDVVIYYVPPEEMNARMYVDQPKFSQEDTLEVHVENWGPVILLICRNITTIVGEMPLVIWPSNQSDTCFDLIRRILRKWI